jgi:GT2 family glycosyltransferase
VSISRTIEAGNGKSLSHEGGDGTLRVAGPIKLARLLLLVHLDAIASSPLAYLKAVLWRLRGFRVRSRGRLAALTAGSRHAYELWMARHEQRAWDEYRTAGTLGTVPILPLIDCRTENAGLDRTIASLGTAAAARAIIVTSTSIKHEMSASAAGALLEKGEAWVCLLRAGDQLAPGALSIYEHAITASPGARLIYADDDLVDGNGFRSRPHLKPDWNPELFECHDFISHACVMRVHPDALRSTDVRATVSKTIDEAVASGSTPIHIPLVLHHRETRPRPIVPPKPSAMSAEACPTVTVIIPTRNKVRLLTKCMEGLRATNYPRIETIIVDNGSDEADAIDYLEQLQTQGVTVLRRPGPFNYSALNNAAVEHSGAELICFLNNDVEMIDNDWLSLLAGHAVREDIGAVGPRLLYPDGTVQHAGVVLGVGGGAAHAHRLQHKDAVGYFERARLPQRVSAVTAACLVLKRRRFLDVNGFDEVHFPVAFNDVDLCLKLNAKGWQSFFEPGATLIHHESKSRGRDTTKVSKARFAGELAALKRKWRTDQLRDPYHHPCLSSYTEQFLLSL